MIKLNRILLPIDFSTHGERAAQYAFALAEKFGSQVHVLHVLETLPAPAPEFVMGLAINSHVQESAATAERGIAHVIEKGGWKGRDIVTATADGSPFLEIIRYAKEHDVDLIVMGTHGRSGLQHVLIGSVAERVVRKAPCPVLTVRPEGHQFVMP